MLQQYSPISSAPTMRPLPFSVWKARRTVSRDSRSLSSSSQAGKCTLMASIASRASSMNSSRMSGSISWPVSATTGRSADGPCHGQRASGDRAPGAARNSGMGKSTGISASGPVDDQRGGHVLPGRCCWPLPARPAAGTGGSTSASRERGGVVQHPARLPPTGLERLHVVLEADDGVGQPLERRPSVRPGAALDHLAGSSSDALGHAAGALPSRRSGAQR